MTNQKSMNTFPNRQNFSELCTILANYTHEVRKTERLDPLPDSSLPWLTHMCHWLEQTNPNFERKLFLRALHKEILRFDKGKR